MRYAIIGFLDERGETYTDRTIARFADKIAAIRFCSTLREGGYVFDAFECCTLYNNRR